MKTQKKNYKDICVRNLSLDNLEEKDSDNKEMRISGYAAVFNKITTLWEDDYYEYREVIDPNAFDGADTSLCCLKYNHSDSYPVVARTRNNSLTLDVDEKGLHFEARIIDTTDGVNLYKSVREGLLDKCSFAFTVKETDSNVVRDDVTKKTIITRTIKKFDKIFDVSIVDIPAYDDTEVSARDMESISMEIERLKQLESDTANKRKKLLLKLKLLDV